METLKSRLVTTKGEYRASKAAKNVVRKRSNSRIWKDQKDEFHLRRMMKVNKCFVRIFENISRKLRNTQEFSIPTAHTAAQKHIMTNLKPPYF